MNVSIAILNYLLALACFVVLLLSGIQSFIEKERRAGLLFLLAGVILPAWFMLPLSLSGLVAPAINVVFLASNLLLILFFLLPFRRTGNLHREDPGPRFDERDTMFSRKDLVPGTEQFMQYYDQHGDVLEVDNSFRKNPGLLSGGARYFHPLGFNAARSMFSIVSHLHALTGGKSDERKTLHEPAAITRFIREWSRQLGAHAAGVTELRDYHFYSVAGRHERYGQQVTNDLKYAIAFTVEMDHEMVRSAPEAATVMESARRYLSSGMIAVTVADFIRRLGFRAEAHIDARYKVVCPLVARDAGLGDIGRMGILMTPRLGPRVRISVVTTDMELITDKPGHDPAMVDFCRQCLKCARVCPSGSIPAGQRSITGGALRWKINSESCYTYWTKAGTDCARCMAVCPFAHPDNFLHRAVRILVRNNFLFRKMAIRLDDLFYGKKPSPGKMPWWIRFSSK